jgi:hypothetical protein
MANKMPHRTSSVSDTGEDPVQQNVRISPVSSKFVVYSTSRSAAPENPGSRKNKLKTEERWTMIWADELGRAFREFSKQAGRLTRLAQRKKCRIPSEAFNHLLRQQMGEVERSFDRYMRRKEELLTYIKATASQRD